MAQSIFMKKLRDSMGVIFFIVALLFVASIAFRGLFNKKRGATKQENTIAVVGTDRKIDYADYARELDAEIQNAHDRGQNVDDFTVEDLREQAWHTIINREILKPQFEEKHTADVLPNEIYEKLRLNPPDWIRQHPQFQTNGQFDYQKYVEALNNQQVDWSPVVNAVAANLPYDKLKTLISTMTYTTTPEAMDEFMFQNIKYRAEYAIFGPQCGEVPVDTSETALKKYYEEHGDSLVENPYVTFSYIAIPYLPSKRDSDEVRVDVDTVMSRLAQGDDFEMLASAYSQDAQTAQNGGELGWFTRGRLVKEFEEAAFELDSGEVSQPVLTQYGWHIIRCTGIKVNEDTLTGKTDTLHHLQHILFRIEPGFETSDSIEAFADEVHRFAKKEGLEAAAEKFGLEIYHTPPVGPDEAIPEIGLRTMLNEYAFKHGKGSIPDVIMSNNKYFIVSVDEVVPEKFKNFDEAKWYVKKKIKEAANRKHCEIVAHEALAKIRKGASLEGVAAEYGAEYGKTPLVGIFEPIPDHGFDPWISGAVMGIDAEDSVSNVIATDDGRFYIVKLLEYQHPELADFGNQKEQLRMQIFQAKRDNAYNQWFSNLREHTKIEDFRMQYFGIGTEEPQDTSTQ